MGELCLSTLLTHICIAFSQSTGVQKLESDCRYILALCKVYLLIYLDVSKQLLVYLDLYIFLKRTCVLIQK